MAQAYEKFFGEIDSILQKAKNTQREGIRKAAAAIAQTIAEDNIVYTFGAGHSSELAEDLCFRAGTLAPVYAIPDLSISGPYDIVRTAYLERIEGIGVEIFKGLRAQKGDIFIVISNSGRNAVPIELAQEARDSGHKVIALTSVDYSYAQDSRHSRGKRLVDYADIVIDNCGKPGDACLTTDQVPVAIGPSSTIVGAYLLTAIMVQAAADLANLGIKPPIFVSGNYDDGMQANEALLTKYWNRIRVW